MENSVKSIEQKQVRIFDFWKLKLWLEMVHVQNLREWSANVILGFTIFVNCEIREWIFPYLSSDLLFSDVPCVHGCCYQIQHLEIWIFKVKQVFQIKNK